MLRLTKHCKLSKAGYQNYCKQVADIHSKNM